MLVYRVKHSYMSVGIRSTLSLVMFLCSAWLSVSHASAAGVHRTRTVSNLHTVTPALSNGVLINPGQGWVLYGNPQTQTASTLAYASVGYMRYNWSDIEPEEGKYNWPLIDNDLNAWAALGKKFAFGVMNANSSTPTNPYVTPKWVFQDGAVAVKSWTYDNILGRNGVQYIPVWDNAIFLHKVRDFVAALAQRYDGNPNIAYIDIRSYGNWGVQNVNGLPRSVLLSPQGAETHIQIYRNAFQHTQLIVPWGTPAYQRVYTWAVNQHIGLRRDGILVRSDGRELSAAYGKAPIVFEFYSSYNWLSQKGYWNEKKLVAAIAAGRPSYVSLGVWGNDAQLLLTQQGRAINRLTNIMGYHFVLSSATLPITITNGQATTLSFSWKNQGVASLYQSASVAVALLDASNTVVQKQWLSRVNPRTWAPGKTTVTKSTVTFKGVHAGTYKLAVGLFVHMADSTPTYQIGNKGRTSTGWYVISTREVVMGPAKRQR